MKSAASSIKKHRHTSESRTRIYTAIVLTHFFVFLTTFPKNASSQLQNGGSARDSNGDRAVAACSNLKFEPRRFYFQDGVHFDSCQREMADWLDEINRDMREFNVLTSDFAWGVSVDPDNPKLAGRGAILDKTRSKWRRGVCGKVAKVDVGLLIASQRRQLNFLCKGATLNSQETESLGMVLDEMQSLYTTSKICVPTSNHKNVDKEDYENDIFLFLRDVDDILSKRELCQNSVQSCNTNDKVTEDNLEKGIAHFDSYKETNDNQRNKGTDDKITNFKQKQSLSKDAISIGARMAADFENSEETFDGICFSGEPDLERLMTRSRNEAVLRWAWLAWRERTGPPMRPMYQKMVEVKNSAARRSGYSDLGEIWREELETPNLEALVDGLLQEVSHLYRTLHGVVRFFLRRYYGPDVVSERGPIPAHLLGNMWAQNWESIIDVILPEAREADLDRIIRNTNWTTHDMLKRAEDFYTSIGLFPMTEKFWKYSYFGDGDAGSQEERRNQTAEEKKTRGAKCHGTAANMFLPGDFRMIYCAGLSMEDFYVIHHEMGHIEYYMSYDPRLPTIFQDGANSAFQESIGDSIMYAVLTPQHLQRLGLIKDNLVYSKHQNQQSIENTVNTNSEEGDRRNKRDSNTNKRAVKHVNKDFLNSEHRRRKSITKKRSMNLRINEVNNVPQGFEMSPTLYLKDTNSDQKYTPQDDETSADDDHDIDFDTILLLRQALTKLPQIPFGYIVDKYRWDIFSGKIKPENYNRAFWDYVTEYQGIQPPGGDERSEYYFDAAAKFHVPDNTPYVRYFLSSFLQVQMFRGLCQWSLFGQASPDLQVPMPLHRCDIYGSKKAGRKLREMMTRGSSVHWSEALFILTGDRSVSSSALHEYFAPLKNVLTKLIIKHNIPLGW